MDIEGIEVSVLFPTGGFNATRLPEKEYAAAFCRAYNNWIAGVCGLTHQLQDLISENTPRKVLDIALGDGLNVWDISCLEGD